ncbi:MAG: hypothetical protein M5U11_00500 [Anaerolineales bacterium]|nr:hypothetical protein [Anaerolineales bacterium]
MAFAEWTIQGKAWNSDILPKGQTAESVVRDVIEKTFSEERNWDPDRGELLLWLKWVIKSEVSHLAESASNKKDVHVDQLDGDDPEMDRIEYEASHQPYVKPLVVSPEEAMIAMETEDEIRTLARSKIDLLLEACNGQPELEAIVYAISDGKCLPKPQSLEEYLGKPVKEINQHLRTLRRRASKIRIEAEYERE